MIWQVAGLSFLYYIGSPQSKEGEKRTEAKLDEILRRLDHESGAKLIREVDLKYPRK